jgi:hypothetical protein
MYVCVYSGFVVLWWYWPCDGLIPLPRYPTYYHQETEDKRSVARMSHAPSGSNRNKDWMDGWRIRHTDTGNNVYLSVAKETHLNELPRNRRDSVCNALPLQSHSLLQLYVPCCHSYMPSRWADCSLHASYHSINSCILCQNINIKNNDVTPIIPYY